MNVHKTLAEETKEKKGRFPLFGQITPAANAGTTEVLTEYHPRGEVYRVSAPFASGASAAHWTWNYGDVVDGARLGHLMCQSGVVKATNEGAIHHEEACHRNCHPHNWS